MVQAIRLVRFVPKVYLWLEDIPGHVLKLFHHFSTHYTHHLHSQAKGKSGLILWVLWRPSFTSNNCFELEKHHAQHSKCETYQKMYHYSFQLIFTPNTATTVNT